MLQLWLLLMGCRQVSAVSTARAYVIASYFPSASLLAIVTKISHLNMMLDAIDGAVYSRENKSSTKHMVHGEIGEPALRYHFSKINPSYSFNPVMKAKLESIISLGMQFGWG